MNNYDFNFKTGKQLYKSNVLKKYNINGDSCHLVYFK